MTAASLRVVTAPVAPGIHDDAQRLFDALADHLSTSLDAPGREPTPGEIANAQIDDAWATADVVSFDIFDTLIVRKVASPRDVFLQLAIPSPFSGWGIDAVSLAQHRQLAENEARQHGATTRGSGEVTLHEIHTVLAQRLGRTPADVKTMVRAEQLVEMALCVAHPYLVRCVARAKADGKQVWFVSDTYHEVSFLRELLEGCGFAMDGVQLVSSADERMSKGEGKLLLAVAERAKVAPGRVLHIGDHPVSDFRIPMQQGFMAVLHPWAASRHSDRHATTPGDAIALGLAQIGSRTVEPAFPYWFRFGYAVAGPMLSGFAMWLRERFLRDGVERSYFLLRDGEIIHDVYRALHGDRPGPELALLESSRRAFVMPALGGGNPSITSQLLACENPMPAREFLSRIGLRSRDFDASFRAVGLQPDDIIVQTDHDRVVRMVAMFARTDVVHAMLAQSKVERKLLMRYMQDQGVLAKGRIGLVDIGWSGTIQKALVAAAKADQRTVDVHGFYLGTFPRIVQDLGGSSASGFLFHAGVPNDQAQAVMQLVQLVEFICTTNRGSLHGFRQAGARVVPVHGAVDHDTSQCASLAQLRDGALAYARALVQEQRVFGEQPISAAAAMRHLAHAIVTPTAEDAARIGDIRHGDGLGTDRTRALARFSDGAFTPESLLRDHAGAYWPAGLVARREPAAMALRTLLWLRGA